MVGIGIKYEKGMRGGFSISNSTSNVVINAKYSILEGKEKEALREWVLKAHQYYKALIAKMKAGEIKIGILAAKRKAVEQAAADVKAKYGNTVDEFYAKRVAGSKNRVKPEKIKMAEKPPETEPSVEEKDAFDTSSEEF